MSIKKRNTICIIIFIATMIYLLHDCGKTDPPVVLDFSQEIYGDVDPQGLRLQHGDILSIIQNGSAVVVKAKIPENLTNDMIIKENYFNVQKLIKDNGFNTCNGLKYWAIMDVQDMEIKVISFDMDKSLIDAIYADRIYGSDIGNYVENLWISPILQK